MGRDKHRTVKLFRQGTDQRADLMDTHRVQAVGGFIQYENLINDLNLASKLEYNMQPVNIRTENAVALVRQVAVDFINMDIEAKYPIIWDTPENLSLCPIPADRDLLKRAVSNLIQNSINHNEEGCHIYVSVKDMGETCEITVADDGVGASDEMIERLNHAPHYMVCDENTVEQQHGLGLLIVKQIAASHHGDVQIGHSPQGGFAVRIRLNKAISIKPL